MSQWAWFSSGTKRWTMFSNLRPDWGYPSLNHCLANHFIDRFVSELPVASVVNIVRELRSHSTAWLESEERRVRWLTATIPKMEIHSLMKKKKKRVILRVISFDIGWKWSTSCDFYWFAMCSTILKPSAAVALYNSPIVASILKRFGFLYHPHISRALSLCRWSSRHHPSLSLILCSGYLSCHSFDTPGTFSFAMYNLSSPQGKHPSPPRHPVARFELLHSALG